MNTSLKTHFKRAVLPLAVLTGAAMLASAPAYAIPTAGIVCNYGPVFNLTTKTGYVQLPDSTTMYMWGFSFAGQPFQHPAPTLCVTEGQPVTINLSNPLPYDVSIIFPGQEGVMANGAPSQPQFDANGLTSLATVAVKGGGSVTYTFTASKPGTYIYESGADPENQVRMGLFGALIVRPALGVDYAYNRADTRFTTAANTPDEQRTWDEEFMVMLSDIDPYHHQAFEAVAETGGTPSFNLANYLPRYWMLNGRGLPDTLADNGASWLPEQPYGALPRIHPWHATNHPHPGLIRYLNIGTEDYPFHPHGQNGRVVGRDGVPLENALSQDISFEKFVINSAPSQTWDVLFSWFDAEKYDANTNPVFKTDCAPGQSGPCVSFQAPDPANLEYGPWYSGSPYLGTMGALLPGATTLAQCGEYYIISHNHALFQLTSWGGFVNTGPGTFLRVDPPLPNNCP